MPWAGLLAFAGLARTLYRLVANGALTLDTGIGRRLRPLGPVHVVIEAPPEVVFDVIAGPYLGRTPRDLAGELEVVERGSDLVLAAHFTPVNGRRTTTLETVRFQPPERGDFRLVRGPVPLLLETFAIEASSSQATGSGRSAARSRGSRRRRSGGRPRCAGRATSARQGWTSRASSPD